MRAVVLALLSIALVALVARLPAVQPMPGGLRVNWSRSSNDLSFTVWRLPPATTNWQFLAGTTNTDYLYTNATLEGTMFGVTALQRRANGTCCVAVDVGIAGWPPAILTPTKSVRLTPTNGFVVSTGQWVKVSSDLARFDDWLKLTAVTNGVRVEHRASAIKPYLFFAYPSNPPAPPFPAP